MKLSAIDFFKSEIAKLSVYASMCFPIGKIIWYAFRENDWGEGKDCGSSDKVSGQKQEKPKTYLHITAWI